MCGGEPHPTYIQRLASVGRVCSFMGGICALFFFLLLFGRGGGRAFSVVQSETICRGMPTSPWRRCPRVPGHVNRYLRERKTLIVRVILSV